MVCATVVFFFFFCFFRSIFDRERRAERARQAGGGAMGQTTSVFSPEQLEEYQVRLPTPAGALASIFLFFFLFSFVSSDEWGGRGGASCRRPGLRWRWRWAWRVQTARMGQYPALHAMAGAGCAGGLGGPEASVDGTHPLLLMMFWFMDNGGLAVPFFLVFLLLICSVC